MISLVVSYTLSCTGLVRGGGKLNLLCRLQTAKCTAREKDSVARGQVTRYYPPLAVVAQCGVGMRFGLAVGRLGVCSPGLNWGGGGHRPPARGVLGAKTLF